MRNPQDNSVLFLVVAVTLAFALILWPFYGPILWAIVLATVFAPAYQRLLSSMQQRNNLAAVVTVLIIVTIVVLPSTLTAMSVVQEATSLYARIEAGEVDFSRFLSRLLGVLPAWMTDLLGGLGINDLGDLQARLAGAFKEGSQFLATQAIAIGQGTAHIVVSFFLMLYLLFFFLRDGTQLSQRLTEAIPLRPQQKQALFGKFTIVIRAMFKGTLLVAALQGILGGMIFWTLGIPAPVLWGVVMAFLSLLPAVGAALVWLPVALYLLATGALWEGIVLIAYGALVIGLVDNLLRPFLIGMDTKLPDYVVLISTLGGIAVFGLNGFVIGPVVAAMFIATWDIFLASNQTSRRTRRRSE